MKIIRSEMTNAIAYEEARATRIAANRAQLKALGLVGTQAIVTGSVYFERENPPKKKKLLSAKNAKIEQAPQPARVSLRLQGAEALAEHQAVQSAREEIAKESYKSQKRTALPLQLDSQVTYTTPFTTRSKEIVTILELGKVHRGAWAERYWSNPGCLYHHAYPVGYRATKIAFDKVWEMSIEEGTSGPTFKVTDTERGSIFQGDSPTAPWTKICIAHKTGQRILGPLYFGFSDPTTIKAIASCLYNEREKEAAVKGVRLQAETLTEEEVAALEFQTLEGVGESVARVLAMTTSLGGRKHSGLKSLQTWAQSRPNHGSILLEFLLENEQVPEAIRRWPAWRHKMVPKIVEVVAGLPDTQ